MTVIERVYSEISRKSGCTEAELAALLFGRENAYQQRVNPACRQLVAQGRVIRKGKGGLLDPFTYSLPEVKITQRLKL